MAIKAIPDPGGAAQGEVGGRSTTPSRDKQRKQIHSTDFQGCNSMRLWLRYHLSIYLNCPTICSAKSNKVATHCGGPCSPSQPKPKRRLRAQQNSASHCPRWPLDVSAARPSRLGSANNRPLPARGLSLKRADRPRIVDRRSVDVAGGPTEHRRAFVSKAGAVREAPTMDEAALCGGDGGPIGKKHWWGAPDDRRRGGRSGRIADDRLAFRQRPAGGRT